MNNVAITIDEKNHLLKVLFLQNKSIGYREYSFSSEYIKNSVIDYDKIFSQTLDAFINEINILPASIVYVLSDRFAACDYFEIPSFAGKKLTDTLNLEFSTRYKQSEKLKTVFVPMGDHGPKSTFFAYMIAHETINSVLNALKPYKFSSRNVTFEAAMIANAFLELKTLRRHDAILFADIKNSETKLIAIKDSKLAGFSSIPYGNDLLSCKEKIVSSPSILSTKQFYTDNASAIDLCKKTTGDNKDNVKFLLRTLLEMCDTLNARYHMENIALKINSPKAPAIFTEFTTKEYKGLDPLNVKNPLIAQNMELYGALNPKLYNKGLLF